MARLIAVLVVSFALVLVAGNPVLAKGGGGHSGRGGGHGSGHGGGFRLFDDRGGRHGEIEVERHHEHVGGEDEGRPGNQPLVDDSDRHSGDDSHLRAPHDIGHGGRLIDGLPWLRQGQADIEHGIGHQ